MSTGARTPEELEALLEDAFVTRDVEALTAMFGPGAILAVGGAPGAARGATEIGRLAAVLWEADRTYVADPRRIVQAGNTALVLGDQSINVVRRGSDGGWRYAIALLSCEITNGHEEES
jgi:Domain of unknown function (DUF4440)